MDQKKSTQQLRLLKEQEQVEKAKRLKRRREVLLHRTHHELILGGERFGFQER